MSRLTAVVPSEDVSVIRELQHQGYRIYNDTNERVCLEKIDGFIQFDNSYGTIIFNREKTHVLLMKTPSGHWCFPKGHKEGQNESDKQAAIREVYEEIGLKLYVPQLGKPLRSKFILSFTPEVHAYCKSVWHQRRGKDVPFRYPSLGPYLQSCTLFIVYMNVDLSRLRLEPTEAIGVNWFSIERAKQLLENSYQAELFLDSLTI